MRDERGRFCKLEQAVSVVEHPVNGGVSEEWGAGYHRWHSIDPLIVTVRSNTQIRDGVWSYYVNGQQMLATTREVNLYVNDLETWNSWSTAQSITASSYTRSPWTSWTRNYVTYSASTNSIWTDWTEGYATTYYNDRGRSLPVREQQESDAAWRARRLQERVDAQRISDEVRRQRQAEARQREEERREVMRLREEAAKVAMETLLSILQPEERLQYEQTGQIVVVGSEGNLYRIEKGHAGNVSWINKEGFAQGRFCAHPPMSERVGDRRLYLPDEDAHIAQILALKTDERSFHQVANLHHGVRPRLRAVS